MSVLTSMAAVSCGLQIIGEVTEEEKKEVWTGPGTGIVDGGSESSKESVWYMTALDYPEGYEWKTEQETENIRCSLVVFANGVPMLKVPVGHESEVSSAPDMHRMICGDLYTDYCSDSLTVIRKNGKGLLRYPGTEMIVGMRVDGEDVYTLGQSRSGRGFSYRKNGEIIMERRNGTLFNAFFETDGGCAFAFYESVGSQSETTERYFVCVNGAVSQVAVREDVTKVWDVLVRDGKVYYIADMAGTRWPVLVSGEETSVLEMSRNTVMKVCRFMPSDSGIIVDGIVKHIGKDVMTGGLWNGSRMETMFPSGYRSVCSCACDGGIFCILEEYVSGNKKIYRDGDICDLPEGYTVMGTKPMAMIDGILHVGLTSVDGTEAAIWKDGELQPVRINGYISSITVD